MEKYLEKINIYNTTLDSINNNIIKFNNSLELISEINKTIIYNNQRGGTTQMNDELTTKLDSLNTLIIGMIDRSDKIKTQSDEKTQYLKNIKKANTDTIESVSVDIVQVENTLEFLKPLI
jgi:hypothetical protein